MALRAVTSALASRAAVMGCQNGGRLIIGRHERKNKAMLNCLQEGGSGA